MEFGFTEEQTILRNNARRFLEKELPRSRVREIQASDAGISEELWAGFAQLGWLGLPFPEEHGGSGLGLLDLAALYEECGRTLVPTALYSAMAAGLCVLNSGSGEQQQRLLPELIRGEKRMTLAVAEPQAIHDLNYIETTADLKGGTYYLSGTKLFVQNASAADRLIVAARTARGSAESGVTLLVVDSAAPGVRREPLHTFGLEPQSEVTFEDVEVSPGDVLGTVGGAKAVIERTLDQATALQCVEMAGGAQEVIRMTAEYVKQRIQFERPIGSFQAVQHQLTDVHTAVQCGRYLAYQAAWALDQGRPCARETSLAKAYVGRAYKQATLICHQLHGGIGYTLEYDLHLYSNRAKAAEIWLGTPDRHLQRLADELGM